MSAANDHVDELINCGIASQQDFSVVDLCQLIIRLEALRPYHHNVTNKTYCIHEE